MRMTDIYEQHTAAFAKVEAHVVLNAAGERIATVAIKFPADGAGRLWAYVHVIGLEMTRGFANGYGYDKRSAAVDVAMSKVGPRIGEAVSSPEAQAHAITMREAIKANDGDYWNRALERAGYRVLQAV